MSAVKYLSFFAFVLVIVASTGCKLDPFCLDCTESDGSSAFDGSFDGSADGGDGDSDSDSDGDGDLDADHETEGCDPEADEMCNGRDDNCNGEIDEGFDLLTDPRHCGRCEHPCLLAHAFNDCVDGVCAITDCDVCFHDLDGEVENGCEYGCCETPTTEVPGACEATGDGTRIDCCDGLDNDCDGEFDEDHDTTNDPNNCGGCSALCTEAVCPSRCSYLYGIAACIDSTCQLAGCVEGHYNVNGDDSDGCEYACTPNPDTGGLEECNSRDDDCDGVVDEEFVGMGEACGIEEGACTMGVAACVRGRIACVGEVTPTDEVCDGEDNDCDGETDEDVALVGSACGTDMGECERGVRECIDGSLRCVGEVVATTEVCNALDDDCDGVVDNDVPDEGPCGTSVGACVEGTRVCLGGRFVCDGSIVPHPETCNNEDDDCDGDVDEGLIRSCSSDCGIGEEVCTTGVWGDCSARVAEPEECDGIDNDCDGLTDEDDGGGPLTRLCSSGTCSGTEICTGPFTWSTCSVAPIPEVCNDLDDDCDGEIDEDVTRSCTNECGPGEQICTSGTWGDCSARLPDVEICDGIDNDCDGSIDEDDSGATMTRPCSFGACTGVETCSGPFTWTGCTAVPSTEICNGVDDDCDGDIDEELTRTCSTVCGPGEETCTAGTYSGCTAREPVPETCNGIDDDCDGPVDEDATGAALTRSCSSGTCTGTETCTGPDSWTGCTAVPGSETCNSSDDDCDGDIDEDFDLDSDPLNCGSCSHDCRVDIPNAAVRCDSGSCVLLACLEDWYDLDPSEPGCEYHCVFTGTEDCNGEDDDCNGVVDDWSPAADYCGFYGVCSAITAECRDPDGAGPEPIQAICSFPATYQDDETWCDGLDNDCDGTTDEGYDVGVAYPCDNGLLGRCFMTGHYECAADRISRRCELDSPEESPMSEICNGIDDDCDGSVDDDMEFSELNLVYVLGDVDLDGDTVIDGHEASRGFWIFQYEASHPDSTSSEEGEIWSYACSQAPDPTGTYDPSMDHEFGVLPWAATSWRDAQEACCGLNDHDTNDAVTGGCAYQLASTSSGSEWVPRGWALCTAPDWEVACQAGSHPTNPDLGGEPWVYAYDSDSYNASSCNGFDYDSDPSTAGNQSFAVPSGSLTSCAGGSAAWGDEHNDMSGNVHEWTYTGWYVCECDTSGSCQSGCTCDDDCSCACDSDAALRGHGSRCQWNSSAGTVCTCDPDCNTFYEYRGGSFENAYPGLTCQFDFNVGADASDDPPAGEPAPGLVLDSLGFRCCYYPAI